MLFRRSYISYSYNFYNSYRFYSSRRVAFSGITYKEYLEKNDLKYEYDPFDKNIGISDKYRENMFIHMIFVKMFGYDIDMSKFKYTRDELLIGRTMLEQAFGPDIIRLNSLDDIKCIFEAFHLTTKVDPGFAFPMQLSLIKIFCGNQKLFKKYWDEDEIININYNLLKNEKNPKK